MPFTSLQQIKVIALSGFLWTISGTLLVPEVKAQSSSESPSQLINSPLSISQLPAVDSSLPSLPSQPLSTPTTSTPANSTPARINTHNQALPAQISPAELITPTGPESTYTLGAGDVVRVDIFRVPQYSGESQVLIDGTLNLPLVGKVNVNGLSLESASAALSAQYGRYLRRPVLTLSLLNRRPLQVGIAGEVNRPGSYNIDQGINQSSRLSQLIQTSGGITQSADLSQVQIRRAQAGGRQQLITVNLWDLIKNGNLSQDITLRDGDSIFIPTTLVPLENSGLLADASFAPDANRPINIAIIGAVYRPGPYTLQGGVARTGGAGIPGAVSNSNSPTTITRAIQVAGGIQPQADIRKVQVVRPTRVGTPQIFEVDLWSLLETGDLKQDAILQEGDTVLVPVATTLSAEEAGQLASASFAPDTIRVNVVGEVEQPGAVALPPNTPLSQAILASGGFNTRASTGSAELVRLNEDGTVTRTAIPVDFAQGINEESNPLLRNNDVIIVNRSGIANVTDTLGTILSPLGGVFSFFRLFNLF